MSLDSLESCGNKQSSGSPKGMQQRRQFHEKSGSYKSKSFHMGGSTVMKNPLCALCGRSHWLAYCETFRDKSVEQRKEFVLSKNLCFNCFGQHVLRNCISKKSCQVCHKKHHTFLHEPSTNSESSKNCVKNQSTSSFPVFTEESIERKLTNVIDSKPETVLLSTAWVKVQGPHGNVVLARALLDQCAQSSFITESLCQRLRLDKKSASVVVSGLGNSLHMKCKGSVSVIIKPRFMSTFSCHTEALVVPKVTLYKPSLLTRDNWPHLKELELADPKHYQAGQIDLLLGAAVHARVVEGRVVKGEANHPIAMATALGWILSGETNAVLPHTSAVFTIQQDDGEMPLDSLLQRFWLQEDMPTKDSFLTPDEQMCEEHFESTHSRTSEGRYIVRLPVNQERLRNLGNSYHPSIKMLASIESKFKRDENFQKAYCEFIQEYLDLGHMQPINEIDVDLSKYVFLPHHGVFKESSTTTRLRTVFNGSFKTNEGWSLNDCLYVGPNLLPEIPSLVTSWRKYRYAFTSDIKMMYRQIIVHEEDRHLQAIVWRFDPLHKIKIYLLSTLTYGLKCSPFIAIRVLQQLAKDEAVNFPLGSTVLEKETYMDDVLSGDHEIHTALAKQKDVINLCMVGGFSLRKWHSNSSTLLQWLPQELLASEPESLFANDSIFAVLGLNWQPSEDCFNFNVKIDQKVEQWTKRLVLSKVAKLFDPLGWIAPVIIWPKTVFNRRTNEQSKIPIVLSINTATIKASGFNIFQKYSNLKTTVHVMAYVIRFLQAKKLVHPIFSASWFNVELMNADVILNPSEIIRARLLLVYIAQRQSFSKEISILEKNEIIPKTSVLIRLTPFIDQKLLKVGGRLKHSLLSEDEKHPLIIPSDHPLTRLIIEDCHKRTLHGGVQLTLTTLRTQYWVLKGRQKIKEIIHKCVVCQRYRKSTSYQIMGNLPQYRTMPNRPFSKSGVDYAGPVSIKTSPGKCRSSYKGFICVFVCLSTRAVHLEAVSNYTSEAFIAAFRRFVGRRGHCSLLLSDKGTNFVGADRELKELFQRSSNFTRTLAEALASNGTEWRFNPPTAPHFGGIWEAAVKSTKHHLRRVIGETKLTFEELSTLLCQVEACLNSRPLVPLSDDPNDIQALTPAHFLIQSSSYLIPEPALIEENIPTLKRWQMVQQMLQHYWRRWSREYLQSLQQRQKWATSTPNIKAGDLVIACNDNTPPARWQLARVIKVHPGDDGYVRVVTIQTANSVLKRPVNNLIILK
ncbi:uncharacterized protein LOC124163497 isoform X1 [Ischnura elegans]|uniref:uncharacterized protein LOC124163497 isoform X1 n=1 Tax=Ischnura elegans TaxID=197161 RepID=UPI001ED8A23E|nr:uncharacterized protein LOC124163497 isoform X1 [Ischnura elegans]